jgi:hypothetical protein
MLLFQVHMMTSRPGIRKKMLVASVFMVKGLFPVAALRAFAVSGLPTGAEMDPDLKILEL